MSNETKQEVFEDALRALEEFGEQGSSWEMAYDGLSARYSTASDEAMPDDLPVIPKAVGVHIRWCKSNAGIKAGIGNLLDALELPDWAGLEAEYWINDNPEMFARAWLLGVWCVKETGEIVKLEAEK